MAAGADSHTMAGIANLAGGLVCEKIGVVPVVKEELLEEVKRLKIKWKTQASNLTAIQRKIKNIK